MAEGSRTKALRKRRVRLYRGRGEVYCWLRAHHAQVAARLAAEELSWATLAEALSCEGLKGRNGVELTGRAVAQVWRRVGRDVEAEAAARAAKTPKRKFPSRISPNWRPQVVSPSPRNPPPPAGDCTAGEGQVVGSASAKAVETPLSDHAREQYARMDKQLARLDRKFRF
jgi:hypothetical protein